MSKKIADNICAKCDHHEASHTGPPTSCECCRKETFWSQKDMDDFNRYGDEGGHK